MKISFNVQGMTCAACSARVEKATSAVPGVASVAVNLLKNSMEVQLAANANAAEVTAAIEAAVKKAGYGASPKGQAGAPAGPAWLLLQAQAPLRAIRTPPPKPSRRACCTA